MPDYAEHGSVLLENGGVIYSKNRKVAKKVEVGRGLSGSQPFPSCA